MNDFRPLVDCCAVDEEDRVFREGVSPFAIDPNPLKRPVSRRRILRRASMLGAAAFATACGNKSDDEAVAEPSASGDASAGPSQSAAPGTGSRGTTRPSSPAGCASARRLRRR